MPPDTINGNHGGSDLPSFRSIEREGAAALSRAVDELVQAAVCNGGKPDLQRLQRLGPVGARLFLERLLARSMPALSPGQARLAEPAGSPKAPTGPAKSVANQANASPAGLAARAPNLLRVPRRITDQKAAGANRSILTVNAGWAEQRRLDRSFRKKGYVRGLVTGTVLTIITVLVLYLRGW
ncbi:hypothetical protein [Bradyrhizobium diazoefficiens]|uniref:hypothetical protein n=1 Tax=Bradyrhizobium diazoefficiens TaxID=1355477 RepID=UPI003597D325